MNTKLYNKTFINEIQLTHFKKHNFLRLEFTKDLILILGENAAGKTSILESIFYMNSMKSFLDVSDNDLIEFKEPFAKVKILENRKNVYEFVLSEKGKFFQKNNVEYKKLSEFIHELNVVAFSNQDEKLISGTPKNRRYFLDFEITRINKEYLNLLIKYKRTLKIRNSCLKESKIDYLYLDIITKEIILLNQKIMDIRNNFIKELNEMLNTQILFEKENYEIIYLPNLNNNMEKTFKEKLEFDILTKTTNYGIHRDDFLIKLNQKDATSFASYGQIRSIIINIKLALIEMIKKYKNVLPILLLDDVFNGIDSNRRNILLQKIKGTQIFITTNEIDTNDKIWENAQIIYL